MTPRKNSPRRAGARVSQRSVERYRTGEHKTPPEEITDRIDAAVRARWQPKVRGRRRQQAATRADITMETPARFGYTAPIGTTDDGRMRRLTVHLPPAYAQRRFDAQQQGTGDQELRATTARRLNAPMVPPTVYSFRCRDGTDSTWRVTAARCGPGQDRHYLLPPRLSAPAGGPFPAPSARARCRGIQPVTTLRVEGDR
ncbi:telomere-protecting terminal protein Tpg [Streptomyces sp. NPDC060031]|uniref:telomere-protecting terminal protein Tpg n=1 Tax=Streptomyces sp. NPDC060031 TaxID=3347043 RepID=UPI0036875D79